MKITELDRPETSTPKQFLVDLREQGKITTLQMKSAARRLDKLTEADDVDDPLGVVLEEIETGKVKVAADDPEAEDQLPRLADLSDELTSKQKLLELRESGSLSPDETRVAARALDKGLEVEQALEKAGAERLLDTAPRPAPDVDFSELSLDELEDVLDRAPGLVQQAVAHEILERSEPRKGALEAFIAVEGEKSEPNEKLISKVQEVLDAQDDKDITEEGPASEVEEPQEEDEQKGADDSPDGEEDAGSTGGGDSEKPRTLGDLVKLNLDELEPAIEKINSKDAVLELIRLERQGKNREGGKEALVARAQDLGASEDELMDALSNKSVAEAAAEAEDRIDESTS